MLEIIIVDISTATVGGDITTAYDFTVMANVI